MRPPRVARIMRHRDHLGRLCLPIWSDGRLRLLCQHSSGRGLIHTAESGLFGGANDIANGAIERGILSVLSRSLDGVDDTEKFLVQGSFHCIAFDRHSHAVLIRFRNGIADFARWLNNRTKTLQRQTRKGRLRSDLASRMQELARFFSYISHFFTSFRLRFLSFSHPFRHLPVSEIVKIR